MPQHRYMLCFSGKIQFKYDILNGRMLDFRILSRDVFGVARAPPQVFEFADRYLVPPIGRELTSWTIYTRNVQKLHCQSLGQYFWRGDFSKYNFTILPGWDAPPVNW